MSEIIFMSLKVAAWVRFLECTDILHNVWMLKYQFLLGAACAKGATVITGPYIVLHSSSRCSKYYFSLHIDPFFYSGYPLVSWCMIYCLSLLEGTSGRVALTFSTGPCKQPKRFTGLEGKGSRISSMKSAVTDTFPEPNRRLLQR